MFIEQNFFIKRCRKYKFILKNLYTCYFMCYILTMKTNRIANRTRENRIAINGNDETGG